MELSGIHLKLKHISLVIIKLGLSSFLQFITYFIVLYLFSYRKCIKRQASNKVAVNECFFRLRPKTSAMRFVQIMSLHFVVVLHSTAAQNVISIKKIENLSFKAGFVVRCQIQLFDQEDSRETF